MRIVFLWIVMLFSLAARDARAFFDPPYVTPEHPVAGETVYMNIHGGVCDALGDSPWEPGRYPEITLVGSNIDILWFGVHVTNSEYCNYGIGTAIHPIGIFPPGSYTLTVRYFYQQRGAPNGYQTVTLGVVPFTVSPAPTAAPVNAPIMGWVGLLAMALLMTGVAMLALRRRGSWLLLLALLPPASRAQDAVPPTITVLTQDAETASAVVEYFRSSTRSRQPLPLQGLAVGDPQQATWLLPVRASGDFAARLAAHPDAVRAKLERMLVAIYPDGTDLAEPHAALRADPGVLAAEIPVWTLPSSVGLTDFRVIGTEVQNIDPYGRAALNIDAAWAIAGGHAVVAVVDTGLQTTHPALRQFLANGQHLGGNFTAALSLDVSLAGGPTPQNSMDVDERRAMPVLEAACNTDPVHHPDMQPVRAGHGTHVAGLIGANGAAGLGVQGTCAHCAIAMWKTNYVGCNNLTGEAVLKPNPTAEDAAVTLAGDEGAQVINMSFGGELALQGSNPYCIQHPNDTLCLAMRHSYLRDVAMVASSGNNRKPLNFPAMESEYAIAAGGIQQDLALWDLSPGNNLHCPPPPVPAGYECGSNWTVPVTGVSIHPKQELVAAAQSVPSTVYTGYNWVDYAQCGDAYGTPMGDGVGICTGTSMSAPQIAGVVGLLRSINPLVAAGSPTTPGTLRYVLATTTAQAQQSQSWEPHLGHGRPDAAEAARALLGKVAGVTARNRVTPLFRLYSAFEDEYADTTVPQMAVALLVNQTNVWHVPAALQDNVPGYGGFPHDPVEGNIDEPGAAVYVLATEARVRNEWPALRPLHLMVKPVPNSGVPPRAQDFMLAVSDTEVEQAHAQNYELLAIQGYIYAPCTPEPACVPPGAEVFWRAWKAASADCATFLDHEKSAFVGAGYVGNCPGTSTMKLGYAYSDTDSDHDGLPDGFEYVAGTNPNAADSDGDGIPDSVEYPLIGVPVSDPCMGGTLGARNCGADRIFMHGFEAV